MGLIYLCNAHTLRAHQPIHARARARRQGGETPPPVNNVSPSIEIKNNSKTCKPAHTSDVPPRVSQMQSKKSTSKDKTRDRQKNKSNRKRKINSVRLRPIPPK